MSIICSEPEIFDTLRAIHWKVITSLTKTFKFICLDLDIFVNNVEIIPDVLIGGC